MANERTNEEAGPAKKRDVDEPPQVKAAREGGFRGGLWGGLIGGVIGGAIAAFICCYMHMHHV